MCRLLKVAVSTVTLLVLNMVAAHELETETVCDQFWIPLKDEKCIRIFPDVFVVFSTAVELCNAYSSSVLSIRSEQEQKDLEKLLFDNVGIENSVWLGATGINGTFFWPDGSPVGYTNWITSVTDDNVECVELTESGKWVVVSCTRRNLFGCEKEQIWSLRQIQQSFVQFRKEQLENPIPVGFVYVQLSGQPDPQILWPAVKWEEITTQYAGLFFRAEGGTANAFNGGIQAENSPRLIAADTTIMPGERTSIEFVYGGYSERLSTGDDRSGVGPSWNIRFNHSGGEVRPRNQSIRIFKRVA